MAKILRMPKLSMQMTQGTVVAWKGVEGDAFEADDVVVEIESEKTAADVQTEESGVLRERFVPEGATVEPGAPLAIVAGPEEDIADLRAEAGIAGDSRVKEVSDMSDDTEASANESAESSSQTEPAAETAPEADSAHEADADEGTTSSAKSVGTGDSGLGNSGDALDGGPWTTESILASPRAKRIARERGIDLADVEPGPAGRITGVQVETTGSTPARALALGEGGARTLREEREQTEMRATIAARLSQSQQETVPVTVHREIDVTAIRAVAERAGSAVSVSDVLLDVLSATLSDHPAFNATFEDDVHRLYNEHNIGVAVDVPGGLVTPVLPDIRDSTLAEIAGLRRELTEQAQDGELPPGAQSGGTFTLSNLGMFGIGSFTPVINPPEVAILGVGGVTDRAVNAVDGIRFQPKMTVSLTFDHRVVDGADAARFLKTFAERAKAIDDVVDV